MSKTLSKSELAAAVAEGAETTKAAATTTIDALMAVVTRELAAGNDVTLPGIGKLVIQERAARKIRNPQTNEMMDKAADRAVKFKPAKGLKDAVNA